MTPEELKDIERTHDSPCSKQGCGRKSIARIRQYFENEDEFLLIGFCEDHIPELKKIIKVIQDEKS